MKIDGQGIRKNDGKIRHDLITAFAQEQLAKVLTFGANKYEERNWERGMLWSKVLASLERHLQAVKSGEDYDPETGELHSAHIMCNAMFLTEYYKIYPQGDDRPHNYLRTPKIGLDVDEVIANWVGAWQERFDLPEPQSWSFDYDIFDRFNKMNNAGELISFYKSLKPRIDPSDIPFEPHCYITSRPVPSHVTRWWIENNGFPTSPVHSVGIDESKVDVAKKAGVDIFVDDCFKNFVELNNAGICTFLWDAPHNQRYDVGFKRIKSLGELV